MVFAALAALWVWVPLLAHATQATLDAPGADGALRDSLRAASLTLSTVKREDATAQDVLAAAQADYARLTGVLYAGGYYGAVIHVRLDGHEAAAIAPLAAPKKIKQVQITVTPRRLFRFSVAQLAPKAPGTRLPEGFAPGQPARGSLIGAAARAGVAGWRAKGHAKASLKGQALVADHANATLAARLTLNPGPRLRFGAVTVKRGKPPSRVRPGRVWAIAGLPEGEVFDPEEIARAEKRLRDTGAFRSARIVEGDTPNPDGTLPMGIEVVDAKRHRIGAGAELSSLEGLNLSGVWLHRNLLGGAERLRLDFQVSGIGGQQSGGVDYRLGARFERPATLNPDTGLYVTATLESDDQPDYRERSAELGAGLTHRFSDKLTGEAGLTYRLSRINDTLGARNVAQLLAPVSLTWDGRDDVLDPRDGLYLGLDVSPFLQVDPAGGYGARLYGDGRVYRGFGPARGVVLAGRAQFGSVTGGALSEIPPGMLFFSGGTGTVRGQRYQSLGVTLPGGGTVGGRSFAGVSGEVRIDVANHKAQVVAFADAGYVGADAWGGGQGEWQSGAGIGGRYLTSVGPIRVDLATPLGRDAGKRLELYIGIGQAF